MNNCGVTLIEGWEGFRWLRAGFSARCGGVSLAYGGKSLNLGWKEEDADRNVEENRRRFVAGFCGDLRGAKRFSLVTMRQVHSDAIQTVRGGDGPLETVNGRAVFEGDGLVTDVPGLLLGVQVADCVPVLVADVSRRVVGAFHAGWRGTLAGIVGRGIDKMQADYGSRPADLIAAVGPSIGPCCYSVGDEVRRSFEEGFGYGRALFEERSGPLQEDVVNGHAESEGGGARDRMHVYLDLWEANRRQLAHAGVAEDAVTVLRECTACAREEGGERRYFSHRAERGLAGRMMGGIGIVGDPG